MGIFGSSSNDGNLPLEARVRALEEQVARLTATVTALTTGDGPTFAVYQPNDPQHRTPDGDSWELEVRELKDRGNAIAAIKLVRSSTGWGLREAKEYVDRL